MTDMSNGAVAPSGFSAFGLHPRLLSAVEKMGFSTPTPVQLASIPAAIEGRDLLATAMTGSGKTAAFLLPIVHRLLTEVKTPDGGGTSQNGRSAPSQGKKRTRALILTPTRELAAQIVDHLDHLARGTGIRGAAIYGGIAMGPQEKAFRNGVEILVATPGRILDHFQYDYARLPEIDFVVLDEADRMLDMGFLPEIRKILGHLPKRTRQTLLFSATMPDPIAKLAAEMLRDPVEVKTQAKQAPPSAITQTLYPVPGELKTNLLVELYRKKIVGSAIVFCRTKHRAKRLAAKLEKMGLPATEIHGNRSQKQRTDALAGFKAGRYAFLVATDVVARGIDIHALGHVVNFDVPVVPEDYIHRIGRTARAEATGEAHTLYAPDEEREIAAIERALKSRINRKTLEDFDYKAKVEERFEVPIGDRIAAIRARKREERDRAKINAERRAARPGATPARSGAAPARSGGAPDNQPRRSGSSSAPQGNKPHGFKPQGSKRDGGGQRGRGR
jgi:ATP-dependent RNA helicase RhlE